MSAINFLKSGGMATLSGDLPKADQTTINKIIISFAKKMKEYAISLQVPASLLKIEQCTYLLIGKDNSEVHLVFANAPGGTSLNYMDFKKHGHLQLKNILDEVRIKIGDVVWAFSYPVNASQEELDFYIDNIIIQYVESILQSQKRADKQISNESISNPEIASGLEKYHNDYASGKMTAFIMMKFGGTKIHTELVKCIKDTLKVHGIIANRADDKEYMEDLFPNIKVYMHACEFGVAVFERITADDFNPNVSLEVGYMLGMGKKVLLLKDKTLKSLPSDLVGKLYKEFDTLDIEGTMPKQIEKWLSDKGIRK
jgi:hypothetical protein